ncbi:MAG: twin-arginine translocase TatA/TatE family subunit [Deltaproteobacteria bacterium]|jgi:Tat protein translocase TatB subunit
MLGIGFWEMLIIAGLILIAVGPDRLPSMVKTVAKFYRQFRRTAEDLRASTGIDELLRDEELKELAELRKQKLALLGTPAAKPAVAKPAVAKPALAKPENAEPAVYKPAVVEPSVVESSVVEPGSAAPGSAGRSEDSGAAFHRTVDAVPTQEAPRLAPDDPGHAMLGAAVPRTRGGVLRGKPADLDDGERAREVPPEGVDVFEARRHEPEITEDELRLRRARIAAKNTGRSVEEILAEEAAQIARGQRAGAS